MAEEKISKNRYWLFVAYPENMVDDWQVRIGEILEGYPYAYCIHDKDTLGTYKQKDDETYQRKVHVHGIVAFPNPRAKEGVVQLFEGLSKPGKSCLRKGKEAIATSHVRDAYEYLVHNTETAKKQGKYQYDVSERVTGNNFDIGAYEQISATEKKKMRAELSKAIIQEGFTNYTDFYMFVISNYDDEYEDIVCQYSGHFERLTKGNYQKGLADAEVNRRADELAHEMVIAKSKAMEK